MNNEVSKISGWQLISIGFIGILSPVIRLLPSQAVKLSGSFAWLSVILSILSVSLLYLILHRFMKNANTNQGFSEMIIRALGLKVGNIVLFIFALWLIFYTAFSLRGAADRYVVSIYEHSSKNTFIIIMLFLAFISTLGKFSSLGRSAEVFFPLLFATLLIILIFGFSDVDFNMLPPPTIKDAPKIFSALPLCSTVLSTSFYSGFLLGKIKDSRKIGKTFFSWLIITVIFISTICAVTVGSFGPQLTATLSYPFFILVRNISIFGFIERLEAFIMGLWVISDYMFISLLFRIILSILSCVFTPIHDKTQISFNIQCEKCWLIWVFTPLILLISIVLPNNSFIISDISRNIVPFINLILLFLVLPAVTFIGIFRKRI